VGTIAVTLLVRSLWTSSRELELLKSVQYLYVNFNKSAGAPSSKISDVNDESLFQANEQHMAKTFVHNHWRLQNDPIPHFTGMS
jgi:hypothetical protein